MKYLLILIYHFQYLSSLTPCYLQWLQVLARASFRLLLTLLCLVELQITQALFTTNTERD